MAGSCPAEHPHPLPAAVLGSILLMGIPMYTLNRGLWLVTVATTTLLITMTLAIGQSTA
jgi:hypothetical protein